MSVDQRIGPKHLISVQFIEMLAILIIHILNPLTDVSWNNFWYLSHQLFYKPFSQLRNYLENVQNS